MNKTVAAGFVGAAMVAAIPAWAHHSGAMWDNTKSVTVTGTVKEFQYTNSHSWLQVIVTDAKGKQVEWSFEAEGPSSLMRVGIKKSTLPPGAKITVTAAPERTGRPAGAWRKIVLADGKVISPRGGRPPAQAAAQ